MASATGVRLFQAVPMKCPEKDVPQRPNRLRKNALVTEPSGRTEGNSPGRKSWVRRRRECEVPWGRHKDLSSPGDSSCAVNSAQDLRPGLFPSVLPDCSVTSANLVTKRRRQGLSRRATI